MIRIIKIITIMVSKMSKISNILITTGLILSSYSAFADFKIIIDDKVLNKARLVEHRCQYSDRRYIRSARGGGTAFLHILLEYDDESILRTTTVRPGFSEANRVRSFRVKLEDGRVMQAGESRGFRLWEACVVES
jgi:hypothetical protein